MLQPTFDNLDCKTTTQAKIISCLQQNNLLQSSAKLLIFFKTKTKDYLDLKTLSRSRPIHGVDRPGLEFRDQDKESCSARSLILFKTGRDFKILSRPGSIPGLTGQVLNVNTKTKCIAEL